MILVFAVEQDTAALFDEALRHDTYVWFLLFILMQVHQVQILNILFTPKSHLGNCHSLTLERGSLVSSGWPVRLGAQLLSFPPPKSITASSRVQWDLPSEGQTSQDYKSFYFVCTPQTQMPLVIPSWYPSGRKCSSAAWVYELKV